MAESVGSAETTLDEYGVEELLDRFESAWQAGTLPDLTDFLPPTSDPRYPATLKELIKIDLGFRWRSAAADSREEAAPRLLEWYAEEVGTPPQVLHELIAHEYLIRHYWGDRPDTDEYEQRFRLSAKDISTILSDAQDRIQQEGDHAPATRSSHVSDLESIPKVGGYEIVEELARGGMGVVYKARHVELNRVVAIKMIKSGTLADEAEVQRFRSESQAAARLDHPNVVPVYEVGEQGGRHYFSMGFVDGESLKEMLRDGPLAPRKAAEVAKSIAEAMAYAHQRGVVHRDLKPGNILIDAAGNPRITDFGLAKQTDADSELTTTGQILGTPSYMPPEQAAGNTSEAGPLSDVYSLGAVLYCMLTGRPPFQAASAVATLQQVLAQDPPTLKTLNSAIPKDLETICLKCLRREPARRYSSAQELADDLSRWLRGLPILARPVSRLEKAWLWARRRPAITGSIILMLLMAAVVTGLTIAERRRNLTKQIQTTVTALHSKRGVIQPSLRELEAFPEEMLHAELREQFSQAKDQDRRLCLAFALAHLGDVRNEFLVGSVREASPYEVDNFVAALSLSRNDAISALKSTAVEAKTSQDWRHRARLAMLALHLEDTNLAADMCSARPDPTQRTLFISECSTWHGDVGRVLRSAAASSDPDFRSGLLLAVGRVSLSEFSMRERRALQPTLAQLFVDSPDTVTHSATGWTLRQWRLNEPRVSESKTPSGRRNWYVNSVGMTMLKVPAGRFVRRTGRSRNAIDQSVRITRPYFLADAEVTRRQFEQFINDPRYPASEKPKNWEVSDHQARTFRPTLEHPVTMVNWFDAILFCNWLSRREGLTPCYERTGRTRKINKDVAEKFVEWRLIPDADGYRLPTEAEWEYACRAGTTTKYSHGDDTSLLNQYAVCRALRAAPIRSRLPNAWGFFDTHGNAQEWCQDWYARLENKPEVTDPIGPAGPGPGRIQRGGSFRLVPRDAMSGYRTAGYPPNRFIAHGLRVARSHP